MRKVSRVLLLSSILLASLPALSASYAPQPRTIPPFGYGTVQQMLITSSAPGRTGQWWCTNTFNANLSGQWTCQSVSGGNSCGATVPNGELVSCSSSSTIVNTTAFAPTTNCNTLADQSEIDFCIDTSYMKDRTRDTLYLYNDYVRVGVNRTYGGAIFELYGTDKVDRIAEHGGSAMQLSLWGYDVGSSGAAFFADATSSTSCDPTPYSTLAACEAAHPGDECRYFAEGRHVSNCTTEFACPAWPAGAPWNPIQAQSSGCAWGLPDGKVDSVTMNSNGLSVTKANPYNFTKTTAFPGMTWTETTKLNGNAPYVRIHYRVQNNGIALGPTNQEMPAIFARAPIQSYYYYYTGPNPYRDAGGSVTRSTPSPAVPGMLLPNRSGPYPEVGPNQFGYITEEWVSACDSTETQCVTVATFSPLAKSIATSKNYVTVGGVLGFPTGSDQNWDVYIFPYRFDAIANGKTVRQWIYDLAAAYSSVPSAKRSMPPISGGPLVSWGPGRLDAFEMAPDGALYQQSRNGIDWMPDGWTALSAPGTIASTPSATSWGPNRLDVFARGANCHLLHWYWNGYGWGSDDWGGCIISAPSAISWGPNRLDIFAVGTDNALWHYYWVPSAKGLDRLGGSVTGTPTAVSWFPGRLDAFARSRDGTLSHFYWSGSGWVGPEKHGSNLISDPSVASWGSNRFDVFAGQSNNTLYHLYWNGSTYGQDNLGGPLLSGPSAASWGPGRIDIIGIGNSSVPVHWYWTSAGWARDSYLGGMLQGKPTLICSQPDELDFLGIGLGSSGVFYQQWFPTSGYTTWQPLGTP